MAAKSSMFSVPAPLRPALPKVILYMIEVERTPKAPGTHILDGQAKSILQLLMKSIIVKMGNSLFLMINPHEIQHICGKAKNDTRISHSAFKLGSSSLFRSLIGATLSVYLFFNHN